MCNLSIDVVQRVLAMILTVILIRHDKSASVKTLDRNQKLISGNVPSVATPAKREGVAQCYINHLLKLAYLAPDIMAAIIKEFIPYDLTLVRLKKASS